MDRAPHPLGSGRQGGYIGKASYEAAEAMRPGETADDFSFTWSDASTISLDDLQNMNTVAAEAAFSIGANPQYARSTVAFIEAQRRVNADGPELTPAVLVCAMGGDTDEQVEYLARKVANLRIFEDEQGKMNRSIQDVGGAALVVSQFTLAADTSRGNRPGFSSAASPEDGERLYRRFCDLLSGHGVPEEDIVPRDYVVMVSSLS